MQEAATAPVEANGLITTLHDPTTQLPVKRRCDDQTMTSVYCDSFFSQPSIFVVSLTLFLSQKRFSVVCYTFAIGVFICAFENCNRSNYTDVNQLRLGIGNML